MTERSRDKPGKRAAAGADRHGDGPKLRGLERRSRVSRRTAARRKSDGGESGAGPQHAATGDPTASVSSRAGRRPKTDSRDLARLHAVLDRLPNCFAVCDNDLVISFANRALSGLLGGLQAELRKHYPGFDATQLAGSRLDRFHEDPQWMRARLAQSDELPQAVELQAGAVRLLVICTALLDAGGERIGTLAEWMSHPRDAGTAR